jgi:phosphoglycolate phosphatase
MSQQHKIVVFDLDGVLVNTSEITGNYISEKYPTITRQIQQEILSGNFHDEMKKIKLVHKPVEETKEEQEARFTNFTVKKSKAPLFIGIYELLAKLKAEGYILTINTSAVERTCSPLLSNLDILKFFDFVATTEVSRSKVEKFKIISERYSVPQNELLFVTDTLGDIREAQVAGVPTIAVTWGAHDRSFFTREENKNLIAIVETVEELEKTIIEAVK